MTNYSSDTESDDNSGQDQISDSDSEPECFQLSSVAENEKQIQKQKVQAIRLQKDELKRKRKEIFLQNIKQREEKRQKLASKQLPDHILENLEDEFETPEHEDETVKSQEITEETEKEPETEKKPEAEKEPEAEVVQTSGNITFKCKVLSLETQKARYIPKDVAHFKEQMLYSNRIKREKSTRHAVLKSEKCSKR